MQKEHAVHNSTSTNDHLSLAMTKLSSLENKANENEREINAMKASIVNFEQKINFKIIGIEKLLKINN